ncbi:MAG: BamA/TamA family outer membrane protein [Bacteroidota bacterium]|nr:BamA/TamA family outer membrane protein [Bacteroidota bacterium]
MTLKRSFIQALLIIALPLLFFSCNPTRKLNDGEYLLRKNFILDKDTKLDEGEMEKYIKQKPNRKIFKSFRFHLWLHNMVNEDRVRRKRILKDKKIEKRNKKRIAKGKRAKKNERQLFGEWLLEIGEAPVIYDSVLAKKSANQLKLYLNSKGYFISSVSDSVNYRGKKRADVYFKVSASGPYSFNQLEYSIPDEILKYFVFADTSNTKIKKGNNYDVDVLQQERVRITTELNNNGYYLFTKDYIHYDIDTTIGNKQVNVTLRIKNYARKYSDFSDSILESPHQRFYINNIYIQPDFVSKKSNSQTIDTVKVGDSKMPDYYILHSGKQRYKTRVLLNAIFIRKGELYQAKNTEDTYKRLSELKAFKTINITFQPAGGDYLNCYVNLSPILKQFFQVETEGTNTEGNLGVAGSFIYQNRNLLRGAEVFEIKLKAGVEAQKTTATQTSGQSNIGDLSKPGQIFNTIEIGPEANIYIPRFLLPFNIKFSKQSNPKTIFTSSFIYQRRPDYLRYITNLSFSYTWKETIKKRHTVIPLMINFVKVSIAENYLDNINDLYIINSFSNHMSTSTRYTFTYNEQDFKKLENFSFFKINAESSGNILRGVYGLVNSLRPNTFEKDDQGRYKLMDIVYSQYVRSDVDYRYYFNSNEINKVVLRFAAGLGIPLINFPALPFERSFFSGGANGIRAWQSRTLGPGSYASTGQFTFDQFGDGQLEGNIEYRFKLFKMLHGAVFIDAGNTWLRQADPNRPGGDFQFNRFYKEIAIGSGAGVRADLNFFIIRLDVGLKVRDPQFAEPDRWVIRELFDPEWKRNYRETHNGRKYGFLAFNIGIGYPF